MDIVWQSVSTQCDTRLQLSSAIQQKLNTLFQRILLGYIPQASDVLARECVIRRLNQLICDGITLDFEWGSTIVTDLQIKPFGSFIIGIYCRGADLDMSVEGKIQDKVLGKRTLGELPRAIKIKVLKWIQEKLQRTDKIRGDIDECYHARVPVITFIEGQSDIMCDLTIGNEEAAIKSRILNWMCQIDHRVPLLLCLVKSWAKHANVNSPKQGTFNSFALMQMVVFHLQTIPNAILPPIQKLFPEKFKLDLRIPPSILNRCAARVRNFKAQQSSKSKNKQSVLELFKSFLARYAVVLDIWGQGGYRDWRISTWRGKWVQEPFKKQYRVLIEDFLDHSDNCARTLGKEGEDNSPRGVELSEVCLPFKQTYITLHACIRNVNDAVNFIKDHFNDPQLVGDTQSNFVKNGTVLGAVAGNPKCKGVEGGGVAKWKFDGLVRDALVKEKKEKRKKQNSISLSPAGQEDYGNFRTFTLFPESALIPKEVLSSISDGCLIFPAQNKNQNRDFGGENEDSQMQNQKQRWMVHQNGLEAVAENQCRIVTKTTTTTTKGSWRLG